MATKYLAPSPKFRVTDQNGVPLSGGFLYAYAAGTTTQIDTYSDASGTLNVNPITLDASGECAVFLTQGLKYDFKATDSAGVLIWTSNRISGDVTPSTYMYSLMGLTSLASVFSSTIAAGGTFAGGLTLNGASLEYAADVNVQYGLITPIGAAASNNVTLTNTPAPDPYFSQVVVLAGNNSAANGTTTFTDQSSYARTISRGGSAIYSNATAPTDLSTSILFNAPSTSDYLEMANAAALKLTADFTIEFYFNCNDIGTDNQIVYSLDDTAQQYIQFFAGNFYVTRTAGTSAIFSAVPLGVTSSTWHHFAVTKSGTTWRAFVDGTQQGGDKTNSGTFGDVNSVKTIGAFDTSHGAPYFKGYMASFRITNGTARYTANFTPPAAPMATS